MSGKMLEKIQNILEEQGVDMEVVGGGISDETKLKEDLSLDDDGIMEFVMSLASNYEIDIPEEAVNKAETVGDFIEIVKSNFR